MNSNEFKHMKEVLTAPDIRVYVSDWNGESSLHVRKFVDTQKYSGPTKQGVRVPMNNVLELVQGLLDVYAAETGETYTIEAS